MNQKTANYFLTLVLVFTLTLLISGCGGSSNKESREDTHEYYYKPEEIQATPEPSAPYILNISPSSGRVGTVITITGGNFGLVQASSTVKINGITLASSSWSSTSIVCAVPAEAATGNIIVTVNGKESNGIKFTVIDAAPRNAISVWSQKNALEGIEKYHIYAREYAAGQGWENLTSAATRIDGNLPTGAGTSKNPQIAFDSSGSGIAVWSQEDTSEGVKRAHIYARRYIAGQGWENLTSAATRIDGGLPTEAGSSYYPHICFDTSGHAHALWAQRDTTDGPARQHIYVRRYIAGAGWENLGSAAARIDGNLPSESGNSAYPKMTFNTSGDAIAVWTQDGITAGTEYSNVYARRYSENSGWENVFSVATQIDANLPSESGNSYMPQISLDPSGNAIAVWYQGNNGETRHIYARRYAAGQGWENLGSAATRLDGNLPTDAGISLFPQIDFDAAGNAITVWLQLDNSEGSEKYNIYARKYSAGQGWENLTSAATRIDAGLETISTGSNKAQIKFRQ